jgi:hypothetical protein
VLRYLPTNLTAPEIAIELYVEPSPRPCAGLTLLSVSRQHAGHVGRCAETKVAHMSSADLELEGEHGLTADALLAGPRGRSLCINLLDDRLTAPGGRVRHEWADACSSAQHGHASDCARKVSECVQIAELSGTPFDASALMAGLTAAVDLASYWDEPDAEDRGFAADAVAEALRPVADTVVAAVAELRDMHWWAEAIDRSHQRCTQFVDKDHPQPEPMLTGAAGLVQAWLADTVDDERSAHDRPEDPAARYGGYWWSSPVLSRLPVTTRGLPQLGAVGLALVEDGLGQQLARCWRVAPTDNARVYEIHGPEQWAALVGRYPLDVSRSRRHDWWRTTGWAGRWLIPDYAAVAEDWDAIHVSAAGYLATAGVAVQASDGARTMLAGWDPDATWWLSDVLHIPSSSPPEVWRENDDATFGWTQAQ